MKLETRRERKVRSLIFLSLSMETHKCKFCSRAFSNGRALDSHMKVHLSEEEEETEEPTVYELREKPKKSSRFSDDVVSESETDSRKNPTRQRSKRASPEENVAICLMMLSRDKWVKNQKPRKTQKGTRSLMEFEELGKKIKVKKLIRRNKKCEKCMKQFRSYRALFTHERICRLNQESEEKEEEEEEEERFKNGGNRRRIFKCPFCFKLFGSGQALGGHKRSHLLSSTNNAVNGGSDSSSLKLEISLIDLNLPAPVDDDDDYSVVF